MAMSRMKSIGKLATCFFAMLLLFNLNIFAKGSSEVESGSESKAMVLNYWSIVEPSQDAIEIGIREYTKLHPDVEFVLNMQDSQGIKDIIQSALTTKDKTLDWAWYLTGANAKPLVEAGLLKDLTPYAEKYGWFDFMFPGHTTYKVDGGYYQVNFGLSITPVIYYNIDIFKANGIKPPTTLAEVEAAAKAVEKLGYETIAIGAMEKWPLSGLVGQFLVNSMGSEKYTNLIMHSVDKNFANRVSWSDPDLLEALKKIKDLYDKGVISKFALSTDNASARAAFLNGDAAMFTDGSWSVNFLAKEKPDLNFDIVVWPGWKDSVQYKMVGTSANGLSLPAYTPKEKADVIADFWNFLLSKEMQLEGLKVGNATVRKDISESDLLAVVPPAMASILTNFSKYGNCEIFDMWLNPELHTAFIDSFIAYLNGTGTIEQISSICEAKAKDIMSR